VARSAIPPEEVKVLDINAAYHGVRTITLMERAGEAVARHILESYPPASRVAVLCGKGNNGGDGFVAARHLMKGMRPDVYLLEPESEVSTDLARANLHLVRGVSRPAKYMDPKQYDLLIDAMLGVGLTGRPREPYASAIKALNRVKKPKVSVDVPSGWPSDLAIVPDSTVTFHAPKLGMTKRNSGKIVVADIGIPPEAERLCGPGDFSLLPSRRRGAHKGDSGKVLVIGGGPYSGAPAFTGMAAMRSGIDLVYVATPEPAATPVAIYSPNLIVRPLAGTVLGPEHVEALLAMSSDFDAVALGPGLGDARQTMVAVQRFVSRCKKPMVIDADALGACGSKPNVLKGRTAVLTPHAGEFKKLTGRTPSADDHEKRAETVREAAAKLRSTIVLKGPVDVVSDGAFVKLNKTGNDAMTVGGTGDVLTGIIAGMVAQKASPFAAARIGVFTAGLAGDLAFEEKSYGLLATDVIDKVPIVLRRYMLGMRM
jgi:ADP-dependent NAD(P)H-hydrate dehydratase / NAD(P)H-hydrate epimerase